MKVSPAFSSSPKIKNMVRRILTLILLCLSAVLFSGCGGALGTAGIAIGAFYGSVYTALGLGAPDNELSQTYYLGTFDPQGQVPPSIYRITVKGSSSLLSRMKFSSGWVPAPLVDPLGTPIEYIKDASTNSLSLQIADTRSDFEGLYGRKLILFGPEGFREAPQNQRLVIVMGADPSAFFKAIDQAYGQILTNLKQKSLPIE